ncbi:Uncharacterised protein [Mycobacterium tuberculosis]|uniref:Uncharacterized protein n=1 Tax=Mycobacterium tuberculosis TaxID=1773 RepID=A0A0T9FJI1_MYCTX|nr:Uncharacterised protein [Mycobacterium tuberculosis]CFS01495.1 Uncharacterised protein [Mycobacterium tuberculosis]CKS31517.1 Uncharacterised protein [Mycobacterium tuberculosis]CKS53937.1 Uncharacterised protein [Mycobacterium tuberculosis]CKU40964.1 Uncharacterised protein [Mycobacterium tuberculosis]
MRIQTVQRPHQRRRAKCLLRQRVQLVPLFLAQAVAEPLRGGGSLGQRVQQLLDVARVLREELAVLGHELVEVPLRIFTAGVLIQQVVEVVEHLGDPPAIVVGGTGKRLLHAGKALVEQLTAEQILDLLILFAGLPAAPAVFGQLLYCLGRRGRKRVQLQLGEAGVVV